MFPEGDHTSGKMFLDPGIGRWWWVALKCILWGIILKVDLACVSCKVGLLHMLTGLGIGGRLCSRHEAGHGIVQAAGASRTCWWRNQPRKEWMWWK